MDAAVDRLVKGFRTALLLPLLLAGCQCARAATDADAATGRGAAACPYVTEAEAWVNRMPSIDSSPAKLIVSLKVADEAAWMLKPAGSEGGVLALEVVPGGNSVPGNIAYRQAQPSPLPDAISISCAGEELARIEEILIVQ